MTQQEMAKLIALVKVAYPQFYKDINTEEAKQMVALWWVMLADYSYAEVSRAVKTLIATSKYPPSIAEIIEKIQLLTNPPELNDIEAWAMVKTALRNSYYNSKLEFDNLPTGIQKALGNHTTLREWAMIDGEALDTVVASNFMKSYRTTRKRNKELAMLPNDIKEFMKLAVKNIDMNRLLEGKE